ncbi:MAG TPA: hypothetical protein PKE35_02660 [Anaerolineales bacterium]|nr:hypothetical protein [Anaerolineales bacterium]HMV96207.1 hypothetical protein [Anaerolineales bacterium]HMX17629.1 hypothetical protein [Anaerolineales bacterium]HMX73123.1 hypothetical protein [Anaerolineales bacterium]HMZ42004.1 hypothetical protein [Anaerolineales bacterium]
MDQTEWREKFLEAVANCCSEGKEAVEFIHAHKVRIGIKPARKSVGAFWTLEKRAYLNSVYFSPESSLANPNAWVLLIHEVRHLQQGWSTALSIYGELDAWQYQFNTLKKITSAKLPEAVDEILSLPLSMDRETLGRARKLMTQHAGKGYGANLLPLYPIHMEIKYWISPD